MDDAIVQEVHEIRRRLLAECSNDLDRFMERLKAAEEQDRDRLVTAEDIEKRAKASKQE